MLYSFPFILLVLAVGLSWPLGKYLAWAMQPREYGHARDRWEKLARRILGGRAGEEQQWAAYGRSLLLFNLLMFVLVFGVLSLQQYLPLNPDQKTALEPSLAFNTAASFTSNTNLQHYAGEVSLSYLSLGADALLLRNLLIYGLGGLVAPFIGIKLIDVLLVTFGLA